MSSSVICQHSRKRPIDTTGGGCVAANNNDGGGTSAGVRTSSSKRSSSGNNNGTTISTASRATQAQEYKRRQIIQETWGFREVLAECGLLEFAAGKNSTSSPLADDENQDGGESRDLHIFAWASIGKGNYFLHSLCLLIIFVCSIQQTTSSSMEMKMQQLPPPPNSVAN